MSRKQKNTKYFAGFTNLDEILFQSLLAVVQAKLHFVKANQAKRRTEKEVIRTIRFTSVISSQRSYYDYIVHCRSLLSEFFGFDGIGILFCD